MSIVGTRPPLISETNLYELHHRVRLAIKPGMGGYYRVAADSRDLNYASILLYSNYGGVLMRSKRIPAEEQYRLIMECRQSGLTDHQWCVEHDIKPGTFYNWVKRLRQKGCVDLPASTGRTYRAPEGQEVVRVEFHDTDPIPYEQPLNVIPAATERNNLSVAEPMKLSVGSFHLTIPNGTDPQLLAQTLRIVKELGC